MAKPNKRAVANQSLTPKDALDIPHAVAAVKKFKGPKFDQTVNVVIHVGLDSKSAEAGIRQEELVKRNPELASLRQPPPAPPMPPERTPQITMITNRPAPGTNRVMNLSNIIQRTTNAPGTPVQIQLNPAPSPGSAQPVLIPAPAPALAPPPVPAPKPNP